ncbi:BA14K family protein [Rhizobium lemnae]|uniref:Lectin-like protein BA14k n=1 Tax=Rhizobium lemnae TaxID=1214924 RepID=A0ABV8EBV9_9HYPH|nr:BA14K family protein [Rhizobium lemnae]MCJ8510063.1 BA14K family protein [Rhizobium lemnae]
MKTLANLALNLTLAVVPFGIVIAIADEALKENQPVSSLDMSAPELWTTQPVVVNDTSAYERVPGVQYAEVKPAEDSVKLMAGSRALPAQSEILKEAVAAPKVDIAGIDACSNRYRSYRVEDNTYQPFDGGPRRLCFLRNDGSETANASEGQVYASGAVMDDSRDPVAASSTHAEWCSARYRSYDVSTNSYQPFSSGRRTCVTPYN